MASEDFSKQIRSHIWVDVEPFVTFPGKMLNRDPPFADSLCDPVKIGFLQYGFRLDISMPTKEYLTLTLFKIFSEAEDYFILMFHFTMVGFDEETQIVFMKNDDSKVKVTFKLSAATLEKINRMNYYFQVIVVVEMLELKSLDEINSEKKRIEGFMKILKTKLNDGDIRNLARILKCPPDLKDVFTGRLCSYDHNNLMKIVRRMSLVSPKIVKYLDARSENKEPGPDDLDLGRLLHFLALRNEETPVPNEIAVQHYLLAHRVGLDCYKILTSDYLVKILNEDLIVLDILAASLFVQDKDMFAKAAHCFLNKFYEVTRSEKFKQWSILNGWVARLIIHAIRVWYPKSGFYFPELVPSEPSTTEL